VATAFLLWLPDTPIREGLVGDLEEQFRAGRSTAWYWRQTAGVVVHSASREIWQHRVLALSLTIVSLYLPEIFRRALPPYALARVDALWHGELLDSSWSWLVLSPWSYVLPLQALEGWIAFCVLLMTTAWLANRLSGRQHGMVIALLVTSQVSQCLPGLRFGLEAWWHDPTNPMWFFQLLWFVAFALVAAPLSIWLGAGAPHRRKQRDAA
jgi:hypothetical protein